MKKSLRITFFSVLGLLIYLPGCGYRVHTIRKKVALPSEYVASYQATHKPGTCCIAPQPTITIWIHGSRLLPRPILRTYVYSEPGLQPISILGPTYQLRSIADAITGTDQARFPLDHLYAFGWSGKLSYQLRFEAAVQLYGELKALITKYVQEHKVKPRIRIIAHSHGGNVALNLSVAKPATDSDLQIDELILLACPVQEQTKEYVRDPIFKKVYSIYSSLDMLQVLAPQLYYTIEVLHNKKKMKRTKYPIFSARLFPAQPNLLQVKLKMNGHALMHTDFTDPDFTRYLPIIIDELDSWQKEKPQHPCRSHKCECLMCLYTNGRMLKKKEKVISFL